MDKVILQSSQRKMFEDALVTGVLRELREAGLLSDGQLQAAIRKAGEDIAPLDTAV